MSTLGDCPVKGGPPIRRFVAAADHERHVQATARAVGPVLRRLLHVRHVNLGIRHLLDGVVLDVLDDADDLARRLVDVERDALAEGVFVLPEPAGGGFVDDSDPGRVRGVVLVEVAAARQADADGAKEIRGDRIVAAPGLALPFRHRRPAFDREAAPFRPEAVHGQPRDRGGGRDPRDQAQPLDRLLEQLGDPRVEVDPVEAGAVHRQALRILLAGQAYLEGKHALGIKAQVGIQQTEEGADQQAGADQEGEGDPDLCGHQDLPRAPAGRTAGGTLPGGLQRGVDVGAGGQQRRYQAEQQSRQYGNQGGDGEYGWVQTNFCAPGDLDRTQRHQRGHGEGCQHQTEDAAENAQQHALGEELADETPARSAHGRPDGRLALPRRRLGEQQVGHVRASDEKHES